MSEHAATEVFRLVTGLVDWTVIGEIERLHAGAIWWPNQLGVRIHKASSPSLDLEDATTGVCIFHLDASASDFNWIVAYLRLLHRSTTMTITPVRSSVPALGVRAA